MRVDEELDYLSRLHQLDLIIDDNYIPEDVLISLQNKDKFRATGFCLDFDIVHSNHNHSID